MAGWIICTIPSAGEMMSPGRFGVTRTGSRKKKAHHAVRMTPSHPSGSHSRNSSTVATANRATKRQPSRWIGGIVNVDKKLTSFRPLAFLKASTMVGR
jgi:hypothetical protein